MSHREFKGKKSMAKVWQKYGNGTTQTTKSRNNMRLFDYGGDEENRTPVRKPLALVFYECS